MTSIRRPGRPTRRRTTSVAALAAAALLLLAGCGGGSNAAGGDGGDGGDPVEGGTLNVSFFPDNPTFKCIDPFQVYWIEHRTVIRNWADSLTDQDPKTGEIEPWLAESWEVSDDGLTYTFHLKDGVTFSNGEPLDAQAVADNAQGWIDTVAATNGAAYGASYILGLQSAKAVDPATVEFDFSTPNSSFLQATSTTNLAIIDPAAYAETPEDRCLGTGLFGSGAFALDHYTPDKEVVLTKRETPYTSASSLVDDQGDAHLDEVKFDYVAEDSVRVGNLTSGVIDIAWPRNPITPEDQEVIKASGATVESRSLPGVSYTQFANASAGRVLSDSAVRHAILKATDVTTYAETIFGPDYPVVAGPFDATTPYFKDESDKLAYDPDGAKQLLDDAGWTVGDDGYRSKDGQELKIVLPVTQFSAGPELLQDQLKQVGINLELHTLTTAEQSTYLTAGDYDLTQTYFTRADPGALQFILNPDLSNSKALANNAASPEQIARIKELFSLAVQSTDDDQTAQAYADLQDYLVDEAIVFPIFERVQTAGVSAAVHGFAFTSESFLRLNDVWKS
jgi:peptide/nickel transport system substrate-binding protein